MHKRQGKHTHTPSLSLHRLIANSWNPSWGDNGESDLNSNDYKFFPCSLMCLLKIIGYFKILRGRDECGIEGNVVAGTPKQYE